MFFLIIKINIFWGDLSGISAKTATLLVARSIQTNATMRTRLFDTATTPSSKKKLGASRPRCRKVSIANSINT